MNINYEPECRAQRCIHEPWLCQLELPLALWRAAGAEASRVRCTTQAAACHVAVQVVVTGGAGRTGKLVVEKLLARSDKFEPRAVVRGDKVSPEWKGQVACTQRTVGWGSQVQHSKERKTAGGGEAERAHHRGTRQPLP